ncbi:hypothetical protein GOP47_0028405 [Adiantum capillus-veneris]|nr:hypothetical protein GOP47_0028405 [Adiantum capillus-veneris]
MAPFYRNPNCTASPLRLSIVAITMLAISSQTYNYSPGLAAAATTLIDYKDALSKSLLFFEVQRSGKLPDNQRVAWRGDSALLDGSDQNVDLTGGYYDAGDNLKFGFPMAFTVAVLSWGALENVAGFQSASELVNVREAIRWGSDYLLKASADVPTRLWVQVGDGDADHQCWQSPETMKTPRTAFQINASNPGTEVAAETAAALAAASLVFKHVDDDYSAVLLTRATMVFEFADKYRASNTGECPFYCSYNGYDDELLWAAAWLLKASCGAGTSNDYLGYLREAMEQNMIVSTVEFSWDNKHAGAAVLILGMSNLFGGERSTLMKAVKERVDDFVCANLQGNALTQVQKTPGGLLYLREWANTQYAAGAAFLATVYADFLLHSKQSSVSCAGTLYSAQDLTNLAQSQMDYILGNNPLQLSYMVGFGTAWPTQVHHRGASVPTWYNPAEAVSCEEGYRLWYHSDDINPNEAVGAVVGGPDQYDAFLDQRSNAAQLEPATYINAFCTGVLARLHQLAHAEISSN